MFNPLSMIIPFKKCYAYTKRAKSSVLSSLSLISSLSGEKGIRCTVNGDSFKIERTQKTGIHYYRKNSFRLLVAAYGKVSEHGEETEVAVTLRLCTSAIVILALILTFSILTFVFALLGMDDLENTLTYLSLALIVEAIMHITFAIYSKGLLEEVERVI